jgi:hypothetical protein
MKASINPPSNATDGASYQLECQFALEPSLGSLIRKANEAGWQEAHILVAMLNYASERITKIDQDLITTDLDGAH